MQVVCDWALGWEKMASQVPWHSFLYPITVGAPWCLAGSMVLVLSRVKEAEEPLKLYKVSLSQVLKGNCVLLMELAARCSSLHLPGSVSGSLWADSFPRAPCSQSHSA